MGEDKEKSEQPRNLTKDAVVIARVIQSIFFAVFILGVALMAGDYIPTVANIPISSMNISITLYGLLGMISCEFFARRLGKVGSK